MTGLYWERGHPRREQSSNGEPWRLSVELSLLRTRLDLLERDLDEVRPVLGVARVLSWLWRMMWR